MKAVIAQAMVEANWATVLESYTHIKPFCPSSLLCVGHDGGFENCKVHNYSLNYLRPIDNLLPFDASRHLWRIEDLIAKFVATNIYLQAIK